MNVIFRGIFTPMVFVILLWGIAVSVYAETPKDSPVGSWVLDSDYEEFPDHIIFRSDHSYFVYNSNGVNVAFSESGKVLSENDLEINGAYTAMTEKGRWEYDTRDHTLILKKRVILGNWTDFSAAYGKSDPLVFYFKKMPGDQMQLCFDKNGMRSCDIYEKNWSWVADDGTQIGYSEKTKTFSGKGTQKTQVNLSGYETELQLTYRFENNDVHVYIEDENKKKKLFSANLSGKGSTTKTIVLKGVTKLLFKITSTKSDATWWVQAKIK